jgi:hypothetical protein
MKINTLIIASLLLITTSCSSQTATPAIATKPLPTETQLPSATATLLPTDTPPPSPTATSVPTETSLPIATASDVFGAIPLNSVQAFSLEPVAKAIFDQTLQGYVTVGAVQEFRVDHIAVFPSGQGTLIAEIYYSLHTDTDPWVEDGGTQGADGWITGKCSRFDLIFTETEHQLKNKRLCS